MIRVFLISLIFLQTALSYSQTYWKITSERGEQLLLTIAVNEKKNEFEAYTRKNALKDIAGTFNYLLALTAGKIQYPEVIFIEGKTSREADSLILTGTFYYIEKRFPFRATIYGNHISGRFIDYKNKLNMMSGVRVPSNRPINDYQAVISSAISITERYLPVSSWLKSEDWLKFRTRLNELKPLLSDDYEIGAAWYWLGKNLSFSPYELNRVNPNAKPSGAGRKISIREPRPKTAYVDAGMLPVTAKEMDSLALLIDKKGCTRLVIDLRGKSKIIPESVEHMAGYLTSNPITGGIYLTRKFFDTNKTLPRVQDYPKYFTGFTTTGYKTGEFHKEQGRYYKIDPVKKIFRGKVYILTDSRTSGASSSFIYILKKHRIGTIVGQRASVSALINEKLTINNDFNISLAVADFYTPDNRNLIESDLEPDIILHEEDALQHVLKMEP